ncbi:hypothetical protein GUITHDRAFT_118712 [Guillardia theta CCMP2712]|uniref:Protein kinase domain-containing protein n=1 Tax=Guillardia theta (strain CCMP2712) TaxID=905079 RepID=L1IFP2_GUITC|nr:hypothetical protein GUITHDRAFT_118712 [Guillardia theta CCMP2712]EKX35058.1 hypothetical protein GUITHDRAFT_118712 [Guillardia theta CCMP2712]|eukprot:XP_005822038.1 hypothetical protein GUITHDRAFT_118712 [Guillardia theta CCMP2712]
MEGKRSKWADSEEEGEEEEEVKDKDEVKAAGPPPAKKSKWETTPSPRAEKGEEEGPKGEAAGKEGQADLAARATETGDATSALDMLEDKLAAGGAEGLAEQQEVQNAGEEGEKGETAAEAKESEAQPIIVQYKKELNRCREVDRSYKKLNKIDEGTYGVVYRAECKISKRIVALKQVKLERAIEGFPLTALRELTVLLGLRHPNIVDVIEIVISPKKQVFMVMEYMEHDFRALMETMKAPFRTGQAAAAGGELERALLSGVEFMHRHWVIHRDLKTSNLLLDNKGCLKVCDFGLARKYHDPVKAMTPEVVTLWYRAPELLYGEKHYSIAIDMWSVGCIFAELVLKEPLLRGKTEQDQRDKIVELIGTPDEETWPKFKELPLSKVSYTGGPSLSDLGFEMLSRLLYYDPERRWTAKRALESEFFKEAPLACKPEDMPTWPSTHDEPKGSRKKKMTPEVDDRAAAYFDEDGRFNRASD